MLIFDQGKLDFNNTDISQIYMSQAVVIGASIAGLLAARVLSKYFDRVLILERDRFSDHPGPRQGIPQSYHPHVLLIKGQQILEQFFPGLTAQLTEKEALTIDWSSDFRWHLGTGWAPRFPSGLVSTACTRNLLEDTIRQRLLKDTHVEILEGYQVNGILVDDLQQQAVGVQLLDSKKQNVEITAQLIIDASGRGSKASKWLQKLGYQAPEETTVKSFLGYSTCWYESLNENALDCKMLYLMPKPPLQSRGAVMQKTEEGRWLVNLIGVGKDYPPTDEIGFINFAKTMHDPIVYESIRHAQPLSSIYGYQRTENHCRHYERLSRTLENFIVTGDAVCAFNPVYGQGMTTAARGAIALDECLGRFHKTQTRLNLAGFSKQFQKKLAKANAFPWMMATSDDFRWPSTEGEKPNIMTQLIQAYLVEVQREVPYNQKLFSRLVKVIHLTSSPTSLFNPKLAIRTVQKKIRFINRN